MRVLWGWGGIRIGTDDADFVAFPYAVNRITFTEEFNQFTTIGGEIRKVFKGWRVRISAKVYNVEANDYQLWQQLIAQVNAHAPNGYPYWVTPRYDPDVAIENVPAYYCHLLSSINPEDIGQGAAQTMELEFIGSTLLNAIPVYTDKLEDSYWVDEDDNQYVDESGNKYIMTN
jgi:hypothetical protein